MCKRATVFVTLVTPHLKDDCFTQKTQFQPSRPDVAFLLAPGMMGHVFPPPIFKNCQSGGKANPHFQLAPSCQFNEESNFYVGPGMLGRWRQWGNHQFSQFHSQHVSNCCVVRLSRLVCSSSDTTCATSRCFRYFSDTPTSKTTTLHKRPNFSRLDSMLHSYWLPE